MPEDESLSFEDAISLVKKTKGKTFYISSSVVLPTSEKRGYTLPIAVQVTRRAALIFLADWKGFAKLKEEIGDAVPSVRVSVHPNVVFIGQ